MKKKVVTCRGDGTVAASGKLIYNLYVLVILVCIPQHVAEGPSGKASRNIASMA